MIYAKFLWGNVLLGGTLQIGAKNSNFEIFESALYMKSVSMPLSQETSQTVPHYQVLRVPLIIYGLQNITLSYHVYILNHPQTLATLSSAESLFIVELTNKGVNLVDGSRV